MMDLVSRYVSAIQRYLPEAQQQELGREIQAHLLDQLESLQESTRQPLSSAQIEQVLQNWGHPRQVALRYAPPTPLVNSDLMPQYWLALKYALGIYFAMHLIKSGLVLLEAESFGLIKFVLQLGFGFIDTGLLVFAVVTLFFYAASCGAPWEKWLRQDQWQVNALPPVNKSWQQMAGSDLITDAVTAAFLLAFLWMPLWMSEAQLATARVALDPHLTPLLFWMSILPVFTLLFTLWCSIKPYWTLPTLSLNMLQNLGYCAAFVWLGQFDALLVATGQPLPRLLTIADINQAVQHSCWVIALFPGYELLRDAGRCWRLHSAR